MTRVRAIGLLGAVLLSGSLTAATAADLPSFGEARAIPRLGTPGPAGLITNPFRGQYFVEPHLFDAYGYPVSGPIATVAPNPLFAGTGCPQLLQPIYDGAGNFAGYGPVQGCR